MRRIKKIHNGYVHVRNGRVFGKKLYKSETISLNAYDKAKNECPAGCVVSTLDYMSRKSPKSCRDLVVVDATKGASK